MYINTFVFVFCFITFGIYENQCLKAIFERAETIDVNDSYVKNFTINIRRSRRHGDYGVNVNFTSSDYWGNNYTIIGQFFELLNNQYKPSFILFDGKLCDFLQNNFFAIVFKEIGFDDCPIPPGPHVLKNIGFNVEIPSFWPFVRGMVQAAIHHEADLVGKVNVMFTMINNNPAKTKGRKTA